MPARDDLETLFQTTAGALPSHLKPQLAYRHMVALADTWEGWAQDQRISPKKAAELFGRAEAMRRLADEVGPAWDPPTPATVSITGSMGRLILDEPSPPATPQPNRRDVPLWQNSILASPIVMFDGWTIEVACGGCEETRPIAVGQLLGSAKEGEQVASVIGRMSCRICGAAPTWVQMCENVAADGRRIRLV